MVRELKSRILPLAGLGVAVVLALVGCSASSGATGSPGAGTGGTRTVTGVAGEEAEIPADPQRVVALDEPAALNLLAMGVTPDAAFQGWKTVVSAEVLKRLGVDLHATADSYPELEEVATLGPDLAAALPIAEGPCRGSRR